ncbi:hypothetical protein [Marinobacter sp.]|uniref:hypothetical protein n=1 Tax=Marinobacter sp. TaxID=50741 RepID=UPI000C5923BE|nr:hypothetical protein [Marinobacter sp.]MAO11929.1 hypothetical protein [Marinobacter sp.]
MDMTSIASAYSGLRAAKEIFSSYTDLKIDAAARERVNEAIAKVGEAQDALFQMREEMFRLQEENRLLKDSIAENENWEKRLSAYELTETSGGAIVFKSNSGVDHFACPSCAEKREIQILQDRRVVSGDYDCPGCGKSFPVKPRKQIY